MTAFSTYNLGTVSISDGDTTLVFVGAILTGINARPGDTIYVDNVQPGVEIRDVTDVTHAELTVPWSGGDKVSVPYTIVQNSPQRFAATTVAQDVNTLVAALNKPGFIWFVGPTETEPDPSRGDEGQWANQPATGKQWHKEGGLWVFDGVFKAFGIPAPYDAGHEYSVFDVATSGGSSYVWINATPGTGHAPPNATYWAVLSAKGDQGIQGVTGASYAATSTTSLAIGTGSKAFTTQAGLAYTAGARVRATSAANSANWMEGPATYSGTTLTIAVDKTNGSGTLADWNFNIAGQPGAGDLSSANNLSDLASTSTARTNLGLGTAAIAAIGTAAGTVAAGNDARFVGANVLLNSDFRINQRAYASAGTLAAGAYGHDRWKAGASGGNYSFTQLPCSTTITIASGKSLINIIEGCNVIGGNYVVSWTGTAQCRAGVDSATPSGSYAASPILITGQTAGTTMSVEFNAGTLGTVKIETGAVATPFVMPDYARELASVQRYYRPLVSSGCGLSLSSSTFVMTIAHPGMRIPPAVSTSSVIIVFNGASNFAQSSPSLTISSNVADGGIYTFGNFSGLSTAATATVTSGTYVIGWLNAEL